MENKEEDVDSTVCYVIGFVQAKYMEANLLTQFIREGMTKDLWEEVSEQLGAILNFPDLQEVTKHFNEEMTTKPTNHEKE